MDNVIRGAIVEALSDAIIKEEGIARAMLDDHSITIEIGYDQWSNYDADLDDDADSHYFEARIELWADDGRRVRVSAPIGFYADREEALLCSLLDAGGWPEIISAIDSVYESEEWAKMPAPIGW